MFELHFLEDLGEQLLPLHKLHLALNRTVHNPDLQRKCTIRHRSCEGIGCEAHLGGLHRTTSQHMLDYFYLSHQLMSLTLVQGRSTLQH